ncbi:MAG: Hsp20/alpha crystallin family protein [Pirellulaceae bacterium]|nr:Hsp20/alpha crystallin family protein [Planctomycetales bacterium]
MLRTRWEPLFGVNRLENEMNRLFNEWARPARALSPATYPPLNLWEDDDAYYLEAELPGLSLDDLEILVTGGNVLSIKGLRKRPVLEQARWHRQERGVGEFKRTLELPALVDDEKVSASLVHGVLTVTLPKSEQVKPRKINVVGS